MKTTKIKAQNIRSILENELNKISDLITIEGPLVMNQKIINYEGTLTGLKSISFDKKYNYFIKPILKFIEYNFSPYLKEDKIINISIQIESESFNNSNPLEIIILDIEFPNNIKILNRYNFNIRNVNLLEFHYESKEKMIESLNNLIFKDYIGSYTDIIEYQNKIKFIDKVSQIFKLQRNDINIIYDYIFNLNVTVFNFNRSKSCIYFYNNFNDKTAYFSINFFNNNENFSIEFFILDSNIHFKNNKNHLEYILEIDNDISIKKIQNNIFKELNFSEEGFISFEEILQKLNINSMINY